MTKLLQKEAKFDWSPACEEAFQDLKTFLTNAPVFFMYLMNSVVMMEVDKFIVVFIDDILIYSKNKEKHAQHLRIELTQLREHKL